MTQQDIPMDSFVGLRRLVERLRAPGGCPWDREQTHQSLKRNLLEETYEVLEAIDRGDMRGLSGELGDLLVLVTFMAEIGKDAGAFTLEDVLRHINSKLVKRHPHVFGDVEVSSARQVEERWDAMKRQERGGRSSLDRVPTDLPALAYSQAVQDRAARATFEWRELWGVLEKLGEELKELEDAPSDDEREAEFGDVLFVVVGAARKMGVHAESALRGANRRFYERFQLMEALCHERGRSLPDLSREEKLALWREAKERLKGTGGRQ